MSNLDPAKNMTTKEKFELGLDTKDLGADIVLAGIPVIFDISV